MALIIEVIEEESEYITAKVASECPMCEECIHQIGVFEKYDGEYETGTCVKNIASVCQSCGWNEYS